jgi:hypothetical protein
MAMETELINLPTNQPTSQPASSMEQSASWEVNRSSASQKISRILWNPHGSSPHSEQPASCPYPR